MLKDNSDEAFDLLRMALTSPHFDTADVERIRSQIISSLRRDTTNPDALAGRKFLELAFGDHPYGQPVPRHAGKRSDDPDRRPQGLRPPRAGQGHAEDRRGRRRRRRHALASCSIRPLADCPRRATSRRLPTSMPPSRRNAPSFRSTCRRPWSRSAAPASSVTIRISWRPMWSTTSSAAARCRRGSIAKSAKSAASPIRSPNRCCGWITPRCSSATPEPAPTAPARRVDAINKEIRRIAEDGPTQKELDEAKSYLKGSQMLALDTSSKLASALLQYQIDKLPHRLHREAQRHRRCRDARRRQAAPPNGCGARDCSP